MGTKMSKTWRSTSGLLSLEASIALTIFMYLMLLMFSFLVVFEARNEIAHVLLTTSDSLALDAFANESPKENSVQDILFGLYGSSTNSEGTFTDSDKWYDREAKDMKETIEDRFVAYLAGSSPDEADRILRSLNVQKGLQGLDFSKSYVEGDKLYVNVTYTIEYEFQFFGFKSLEVSQSCCSKLWK